MERKSAQKGRRSADARSPEGSENARRDGARKFTSGKGSYNKGKPDFKGKSGKPGFKKGGFKSDRAPREDGWSPHRDAHKPTREERELARGPRSGSDDRKRDFKDKNFKDRDSRDRDFKKRDGDRDSYGNRGPRGRDDRGRDDRGRGFKDRDDRGRGFKEGGFKKRDGKSWDKKDGKSFGGRSDYKRKSGKPQADSDKQKGPAYTPPTRELDQGERLAKIMARAGLCSRRDAEEWIKAGRVSVNGSVQESPALNVMPSDKVVVDGEPLPVRERTRLWMYHKPRGLVTTTSDPEGRPTVFEKLPQGLPRVITVGRLDINTEGLLLLTNDGGLARVLELPSTGWLRRYRVRAYGKIKQEQLNTLADGLALDGVLYGSIDAQIEREVGDNVWITVALREGKNREVKRVLGHLGLEVNRLIRVSYGPLQLLELEEGKVSEIKSRVLRDQLGERLVEEAGADFEAPILTEVPKEEKKTKEKKDRSKSGGAKGGYMSAKEGARAVTDQKDRKQNRNRDDDRGGNRKFGRDDRGDRKFSRNDDRGGRGFGRDGEDRDSKYAERKPFDPTAPRRTTFVYREDAADGKKTTGKTARRVGGKPNKSDLLDPNARLRKGKSSDKSGGKPSGKSWDKGGRGNGGSDDRKPRGKGGFGDRKPRDKDGYSDRKPRRDRD